MYQEEKQGWLKHLDFTLLDLALMELAFMSAYFLRFNDAVPELQTDYRILAALAALLDICVVFFGESYNGILRRNKYSELRHTLTHCTTVFGGLIVYLYAVQTSLYYSRAMLFVFWGCFVAYSYAGRVSLKRIVRRNLIKNRNKTAMVLVTDRSSVQACLDKLALSLYTDYVLRGLVIIDEDLVGESIGGIPVVATADNFMEYLRTNIVDRVYINGRTRESAVALAAELVEFGVTVHVVLLDADSLPAECRIERLGSSFVLTGSMHIANARQLFIKRCMDVIGGLIGLVATALVFVIFAPIIKVQSPGPVLFKQVRIGKNGRRFNIYKFRSMHMDAEARKAELLNQNEMQGQMFKLENDPRIIPIGRFMRKFSLDEFPQFFNVLCGDMSLVGTRPPTEDEFEAYKLHHKARLGIKPGLTGMWQVSGRSDITDFEEVVALDTFYIANWTLGLDLQILFKTVWVVLTGRGSK